MARLLKPFPELPLKLLAIDAIADRNASLHLPAAIPQATFAGAAVPLKYRLVPPRGPLAETGVWQHGGINECLPGERSAQ